MNFLGARLDSSNLGIESLNASRENRLSKRLFQNRSRHESEESNQFSNTIEVPLFMSRSRDPSRSPATELHTPGVARSLTSTRSVIDPTIEAVGYIQPLNVRSSSVYSSPPLPEQDKLDIEELCALPTPLDSHFDLKRTAPNWSAISSTQLSREQRTRKRVSRKTLHEIQVKARLSIAFGITLLVTLVIYLALAATGIGSGTMFHAMCVMLIIVLAGVFCHSTLTLFLIMRRKGVQVQRREQWRGCRRRRFTQSVPSSSSTGSERGKLKSEKPFPVTMVADEDAAVEARNLFGEVNVIRPPPPVYGNFRGSTKIDPSLIHFQQMVPSPTTPTYDEAMRNAQQGVGYQPPQYQSNMADSTFARQSSLHPLERERVRGLMKSMWPSRQQ